MEETASGELASFWESGIYRLGGNSGPVFMDPVRVLGKSYTRYSVRPSSYYSRSFHSEDKGAAAASASAVGGEEDDHVGGSSSPSRKRKRKKKKKREPHQLNPRERAAEQRHQEARSFLLKAQESFLQATELLSVLPDMIQDGQMREVEGEGPELNFIELGSLWQASQCEISLCFQSKLSGTQSGSGLYSEMTVLPLFDNFICNETDDDLEAMVLNNKYIIPKRSCFYMSDLRQIHNLIPAHSDYGFNLIVVDPPWENASASQKSLYPTLPNRHFLYIPVRQLAHTQGALVALWVTNREKLRVFVEEELFPAWGVTDVTVFYWLKVMTDGCMICDLDLFHHRPYECLVLGYVNGKEVDSRSDTTYTLPQNDQVIVTIPSAYSRKPPLGIKILKPSVLASLLHRVGSSSDPLGSVLELLLDYIPGPKPAKCIELFARELIYGWTSWGNEPLHFQDSRYFKDKGT